MENIMPNKDENLHKDHRKRMRLKYLSARDSLADHELLEMILFYVIPRQNTNPIAHRLLRRFGSLKGVLEATLQVLSTVDGVGESTALFLSQLAFLAARSESASPARVRLTSLRTIGDYLTDLLQDEKKESFYLLMLDHTAEVIAFEKLLDGNISACEADARHIAEVALAHKAPRIILVHNHPNGSAEPSDPDVSTTRYLRRAFLGIDLVLEEHFIVCGNTYCPLIHTLQSTPNFTKNERE